MIIGSSREEKAPVGSCLINFLSRRRLRSILSVTEVALRNFSSLSRGRLLTNINVSLLGNITRWLDSENVLGAEVNNCEMVGIPVCVSQLYYDLCVSNIINPNHQIITNSDVAVQLWTELADSCFSSQHCLLSSECLKKDPVVLSEDDFKTMLNSTEVSVEDYKMVFSGLCFVSRSLSSDHLLRWGRGESNRSPFVHITYFSLVLFTAAIENVFLPSLIYKLMCSVLKHLLNLVHIGGNLLVASVFLNTLSVLLSYARNLDWNNYILVADGLCNSCNLQFFIASSCFEIGLGPRVSDVWASLHTEEAQRLVISEIRSVIALAPGETARNVFLTACLDFFVSEIVTTFATRPVIPATSSRGSASPCSLMELSLMSVNVNDPSLSDEPTLNFIVGLRPLYSDLRTVLARRSEFVCESTIDSILSHRGNGTENDTMLSNFLEFISSGVNPGPIDPLQWISFIDFIKKGIISAVNYEAAERTKSVLLALLARMEVDHENKMLLCHAFSFAVILFLQEDLGSSHHALRSMFCFVLRSLCGDDASNLIGEEGQMALESIESEFIVAGRVCPPN